MNSWKKYGLCVLAVSLVNGCSTYNGDTKASQLSLTDIVVEEGVISLPYRSFGRGIFVIDALDHTGFSRPFLIDTGATRSAIFTSTQKDLGLPKESDLSFKIHGMADNAERPAVILPSLRFKTHEIRNHAFVLIKDRQEYFTSDIKPAGLIGMDILKDFRIFVDADAKSLTLIPQRLPSPKLPLFWKTVSLKENPYGDGWYNLHFFDIRIGNQLLPALLDTGSEINLMNWDAATYPNLKRARKKLYEKWLIDGAVGTFEPVYRIKAQNFRAGQKYWDEHDFLVTNFDGLEILGIENEPFVIASGNLFMGKTFYIDFTEDFILFKPAASSQR